MGEVGNIVSEYVKGLNSLIGEMGLFIRYLRSLKETAVSNVAEIENRIRTLYMQYKKEEYKFCLALTHLYPKINRPHSLRLEDIITEKENLLKSTVEKYNREGLKLFQELLAYEKRIDPLLLPDLNEMIVVTYEQLLEKYKEMCKNQKKSESALRNKFIKAMKEIVKTK